MTSNPSLLARRSLRAAYIGIVATTLLAIAVLADRAWAQTDGPAGWYHHMGYGFGHMMGWGWGMYGGIRMILFWILLIAIALFLLRRFSGGWEYPRNGTSSAQSSALEILKQRYAKGEISKEEYEERKRTLMQ